MRRLLFSVLLLAGLFAPGSARAGETDATLDLLFAQLAAARSLEEALILEVEIRHQWIKTDSPSLELLMTRSLAEAGAEGDPTTAEALLSAVIDLHPDYVEARARRAQLYVAQDKLDRALVDLAAAVARDPRRFDALQALGTVLEAYGETAAALTALRQARALHPLLDGIDEAIRRLEVNVDGQKI